MNTSHRSSSPAVSLTALLIAACLAVAALTTAASASASASTGTRSHPVASTSRAVPRSLALASRRSNAADRVLVTKAKQLKKCIAAHHSNPSACSAARHALQLAGVRLRRAERTLSRVAQKSSYSGWSHSVGSSGSLAAPKLSVSGQTLSWSVAATGIKSFVFVRKVPGQADQYSTVAATTMTPPQVPGTTVKYSVRTAVNGSAWAPEVAISYPASGAPVEKPAEPPVEKPVEKPTEKPVEEATTQAAPSVSVSGLALSWKQVGNVTTYVLATKVPGHEEQFTEVSGTSVTPPTVPGVTVHYSVRTAVDGSAWSTEVAISYPAKSAPPPPSEPEKAPPSESGGSLVSSMWVGVDAGGWGSSFASDVAGAASYVRIDTTESIARWTAAGVKVIYCMAGNPTTGGVAAANASEYASKAVAEVKANPELAALEVLNEPGNQWMGWGTSAGDAANAAAYDNLLKVVHEALVANFGTHYPPVLASYDGGEGPTTWGEEMWAANPNVGTYVNGITLHSYGGTSNRSSSALGSRDHIEAAHKQHPTIPIYITEVGWPTAVGQPPTGDSLQWTEAEQAQNITNFVTWAKGTGYVADVTIFNYRDYGTNDWYGIESASGAHKLGYSALSAFRS